MSDIRFNRWLHQSGTGGVSQDSSGHIGIGTTVPTMALDVRGDVNIGNTININNASGIISATTFTGTTGTFSGNVSAVDATFTGNVTIGGTLTYEDVSNIDAVGIITAQSDIVVGGGLTVTGISTFNNDVKLLDSDKLKFGIGEDLQIYHDGNHSYIDDTGTGRLNIRGNTGVSLRNYSNSNQFINCYTDGTVELFYNNFKKFETTNTGAVVTGILTATTFSGNLTGNVTGNVTGDLTGNLAGISSIAAISSSISDTAVDVFVYDTRKDSDGGAWRKRTQNTSWYNETLNTSTRGSRKEFPAVAVIVTTATNVTIYDGDDPDLPMWMDFQSGSYFFIGPGNRVKNSAHMLNGILCVTKKGSISWMSYISFVDDKARQYSDDNNEKRDYVVPISHRNANNANSVVNSIQKYTIVNDATNDVAMTVLPNAPIDDATGLPVPTIAVATDTGISVITDSGNVYDLTTGDVYDHYSKVEFGDNNRLYYTPYDTQVLYSRAIPTADHNYTAYNTQNTNRVMFPTMDHGGFTSGHPVRLLGTNGGTNPLLIVKNKASGSNETSYAPSGFGIRPGLTFIDEGETNPTSMVAYATTSYNTGWMNGDIKGAFLSDTDTTNATYTTVADDWATAGAWTKQSSISLTSTGSGTSGTVSITGNGTGSNVYFFNPITVEANTDYIVTITFGAYNANDFFINTTQYSTSNQFLDIHGQSGLTRSGQFNPGSNTTLYIQGYQVSTTATTITNVVVQKVSERDRSLNNKALQVFGTINKSAVATGADLVSYSGYTNSSNYLKQPHNSGLDFGTGDFSVTWWQYITGDITNSEYVYDRQGGNGNRHAVYYTNQNSGSLAFYTVSGSSSEILATGINSYKDGWACYSVSRSSSGLMQIYVNGELKQSTTLTVRNLTNTSAELFIGIRHSVNTGSATQAKYALMRFSKSIPSPEQIKKIYEEEKVLFQENVKCTLHGSSDAVTALGYDEDTELLHVGTSSGRSDFQGLRRINNTTTAVTTAISASDELIAEQ